MLEYKGYYGSIDYCPEDKVFYGKVEFINGLISYEGTDVKSIEKNFKSAINDYLEYCKKKDIEPQKSFKGSFNVRAGSDLHRRAVLYAQEKGSNLNKVVTEALENYLPRKAA